MSNRIIKESICTSENIDQLTFFQETVFYRLIVNCDDFGRMDARGKILKAKLFPLKDAVNVEDIDEALRALCDAGLVILYTVDGKPYLQIPTWSHHQRVRNSKKKYPAPDENSGITDNSRQLAATRSKMRPNPIQSNPNTIQSNPNPIQSESEFESESESKSDKCGERFERFWRAYPRKSGKGKAEDSFRKLKPSDELTDQMIRVVEAMKKTEQWKRDNGQYIPYPATWLNQRRWEDEVPSDTAYRENPNSRLEDWDE